MVDIERRHHANAAVTVFMVVPGEETAAIAACILDAAKLSWKRRMVLQRLELRLGERVVVRHMRATVGLRDAKIGHQERHWLALHA